MAATDNDEPIPSWLAPAVLDAIKNDASMCDPARADVYSSVDVERVRGAVNRGADVLAAHRCFGDDEVMDVALAEAALLIVRALLRSRLEEPNGR